MMAQMPVVTMKLLIWRPRALTDTHPEGLLAHIDAALVRAKSSTFRRDIGKRTYIITARRMISGEVLKYLKAFCGFIL